MKFDNNGNFLILEEEVIQIFSSALKRLVIEDKHLLESGTQERALQFKLALYLRELFKFAECGGLNIDVEYNRDGVSNVKRPMTDCQNSNSEKWFAPDIILHERGSAGLEEEKKYKNDIIYCEIKKDSISGNHDSERIKKQMIERKYQYGINLYSLGKEEILLDLYTDTNVPPKSYKFNNKTKKMELFS